jgi:hypothetical protein
MTSTAVPLTNTSPLAEGKDFNRWTVEDVANWLKREGFDQGICDKFTGASFNSFSFNILKLHRQRIANGIKGEVLLALSIDNLKSEFGIKSFGERFAIMQAVKELREEGERQWLVELNITDFFIPSLPASLPEEEGKCHWSPAYVNEADNVSFSRLLLLIFSISTCHSFP